MANDKAPAPQGAGCFVLMLFVIALWLVVMPLLMAVRVPRIAGLH